MEYRLSNIEVILLSIVNEKPSYAYEIDKTIDLREMRRWVRVGVASIYQVLKKLEERNLVYSQREKEGSMPERKRYYVTDDGKTALVEQSKRLLSSLEWYYLDLNVGLETSDLLTPEEMAECLTKRLARVQLNKKRLEEMYATGNDKAKKKAVIKNLINFRGAEAKFLQELLKELPAHCHSRGGCPSRPKR
ncbi:MAG: PadR family transcriptional regulator [Bacillota bacterium]